ncbi:MAG: ABC transporter permease, partial [Bacillota bacterium]|nr:ABC transporter permease [Bacillota bacterium]
MIKLLKCEFKKFKSTYINSLSFLGMLIPIILVTVMFLIKRNDWIKGGTYTWKNFNSQLSLFFVYLVGPIITSFIAVFSVFYEYQSKTMKNVLASPHGRISIISAKMIYVAALVILQYAVVAVVNIICAYILGFNVTVNNMATYSWHIILAGVTTVGLIPIMMFLTLIFKNFMAGMIITVGGTIANVLIL